MAEASEWVRVAATSDLGKGEMIAVDVGGESVAVFYLEDGSYCATSNICTHAFALLTDGWLEDGVIECPLHAGRFDCKTGKGLGEPIDSDLRTYPVKVDGDDLLIGVN